MEQVLEENISKTQTQHQNLHQKLEEFLNSYWALLIIAVVVSVFWAVNVPVVSITVLTVFVCLVFTICRENPKAFALPFLALMYCFNSLPNTWQVIYCFVCAVVAIGFLIWFLVWKIKIKKTKCQKGKMFWAFLILMLANLLGGIIGHFNIMMTGIVFVSFILLYGIYWFYLNFTKNCQEYFAWCAIFLALLMVLEIFFSHIKSGNFIQSIINKGGYVGVNTGDAHRGSINTACIIILTGLCSCFYLALKNKKDYLFLLMALAIDIAIFFSYSRIVTFVAAIISLICVIYIIIKSVNRKALLIAVGCIVGVLLIFVAIFWNKVLNAINYYINLGFSLNGRGTLWDWCVNQFKDNFFFGIGFVTNDFNATTGKIPGCGIVVYEKLSMVYAHNFFLHHLVTIGVVGSVLVIPFFIKKYEIIFKKFTTFKLFVLVTCFAQFFASMFDSTYTSNLFLIAYIFLLISSAEKIAYDVEEDEKDRKFLTVAVGDNKKENLETNINISSLNNNKNGEESLKKEDVIYKTNSNLNLKNENKKSITRNNNSSNNQKERNENNNSIKNVEKENNQQSKQKSKTSKTNIVNKKTSNLKVNKKGN